MGKCFYLMQPGRRSDVGRSWVGFIGVEQTCAGPKDNLVAQVAGRDKV